MQIEIYNYNNTQYNKNILNLYKNVFKIDFSQMFKWWYLDNPCGKSVGVVAISDDKIVGHWAVSPVSMRINGIVSVEWISLAAMIEDDYQGMGIFKKLSVKLFDHLDQKKGSNFIFGFPNENSIHVHIKRMNYHQIRDFSFHEIKSDDNCDSIYDEIDVKDMKSLPVSKSLIEIDRNEQYLKWRFEDSKKYRIFKNKSGIYFIVTSFKNKADLLYWSPEADNLDLEDFSSFIRTELNVEHVFSWNSSALMKSVDDGRKYHFCVRKLKCSNLSDDFIVNEKNWTFYMGDSELF